MQFDAGTWWLAVLLLGGLTGALGYMIKHSFDKIEKKLDTAVPKEDFDTKIANHEAQIRKIQETYTRRTTHDKDVASCGRRFPASVKTTLPKRTFTAKTPRPTAKSSRQTRKLTV